jgi:hypothetical protein
VRPEIHESAVVVAARLREGDEIGADQPRKTYSGLVELADAARIPAA